MSRSEHRDLGYGHHSRDTAGTQVLLASSSSALLLLRPLLPQPFSCLLLLFLSPALCRVQFSWGRAQSASCSPGAHLGLTCALELSQGRTCTAQSSPVTDVTRVPTGTAPGRDVPVLPVSLSHPFRPSTPSSEGTNSTAALALHILNIKKQRGKRPEHRASTAASRITQELSLCKQLAGPVPVHRGCRG